MMMISEEFLVKNLSPQKSDTENIFHQIAFKFESKLMVQDIIEEE